jgi:Zn-dependent protease with chaperone function
MRARSAARFLFAVRMLPSALGVMTVLGLCIPSYLWLEPQTAPERIGLACLALALLGAMNCVGSFSRAARAIARSARSNRAWRQAGSEAVLPGETLNAVIVERDSSLLALAGVFRPRLFISQKVLRSLSAEQLELALQHEAAHRVSRDNLKRLLVLIAPAPLPFLSVFSAFERNWVRFSEWAADDEAAQGDPHRALSLAAALLCLARLGRAPRLTFLHTALLPADHDLSLRVDRLLEVRPVRRDPRSRSRTVAIGSGLGIAICIAVLLTLPAILSSVHRLLELFVH